MAGPVSPLTLAIDIGGTRLKAGVLDPAGHFVAGPDRVDTPHPGEPDAVLAALAQIVMPLGRYHRISIGFPGMVRGGVVHTAPNLGTPAWAGFPLAEVVARKFGAPARLLNDATVQGLGVIAGSGLECVITLGTGFGFALFHDGGLTVHLELGQHLARGKHTYDEYLGSRALEKIGAKKWNRRLDKAIAALETLIDYDTLLIGGGNAKHIEGALPRNARIVPNQAGITGGVRLWDKRFDPVFPPTPPARALVESAE
jgi:polyphosphate glucokinase